MPCNSDYMMPSAKEIAALGEKSNQLKDIADEMVYAADVIRDIVLETKGDFNELKVREALELGRRVAQFDELTSKGDRISTEIRAEYAYGNSSNQQKGANKVLAGYDRASLDFALAHKVGEALINEATITADLMEGIEQAQVKHRIEDVKRLIPIFTNKGDFKTVALLAKVDFTLPLEPQLGFSPDDF